MVESDLIKNNRKLLEINKLTSKQINHFCSEAHKWFKKQEIIDLNNRSKDFTYINLLLDSFSEGFIFFESWLEKQIVFWSINNPNKVRRIPISDLVNPAFKGSRVTQEHSRNLSALSENMIKNSYIEKSVTFSKILKNIISIIKYEDFTFDSPQNNYDESYRSMPKYLESIQFKPINKWVDYIHEALLTQGLIDFNIKNMKSQSLLSLYKPYRTND